MIERRVALFVLLVHQHGMALREGSSLHVLARQAHWKSIQQQGAERQMFRHCPIKPLAFLDHLAALIEHALHGLVDLEGLWHAGELQADFPQLCHRHTGFSPARILVILSRLETGPASVQPIGLVGLVAFCHREIIVQRLAILRLHRVQLFRGNDAFLDQPFAIEHHRRWMAGDPLVHQGLGEGRLIGFVVTEAAIAEHVDDHRLLELLPEFDRNLRRIDNRFGIIAIAMEDRRLDHLRHVRWIGRGTRPKRAGGKSDLVIDDEVDRSAGAVSAQPRQPETLGHDTLSGKSRIAVNEQRQNTDAFLVFPLFLLGAGLAEHHRIDDLEMRGIGGQGKMDIVAVKRPVGGRTQVILDITRSLNFVWRCRTALEFVEDCREWLRHHIGQHIEAAAMRHAEDDLLHSQAAAALDDLFEPRNHAFRAVQTEAFGAGVFYIEELLETLGRDQLVEDGLLAFRCEADRLVGAFDALLNPALLLGVRDMHELDAQRAAIRPLQNVGDQPHRSMFEAQHLVEKDRPVEIIVAETIGGGIEFRLRGRFLELQWVEIGGEMAAHAIGADHHQCTDGIHRRLAHIAGRKPRCLFWRLCRRIALGARRHGHWPLAIKRRDEVARFRLRPILALPRWPAHLGLCLFRIIFEAGKELPPVLVHGGGVLEILAIKLLDEVGVPAIEKRGLLESRGQVRFVHLPSPVSPFEAPGFNPGAPQGEEIMKPSC